MHRGYIKVWRAIWDNPHWDEKPFEPSRAWIDLLLLANYKDSQFRKRGNVVEVKRGQVGRSIKGLADRWGWSPGKVDRYLKELSEGDEPQIEYQKSHLTTIITIINYERYQGDGEQNEEQTENRQITDGEQTDTYKKEKNIKKEKKKDISPLIKEIIDDLNEVCGKRFSHTTDETVKFINGRLSEGKTLEDFKRVHRIQAHEWKDNPEFNQYLRPSTLYRPSKFEGYLNKQTPEERQRGAENKRQIRLLKEKVDNAVSDIEKRTRSLLGMPEDHELYAEHHRIIGKARGFIERTEAKIKQLGGTVDGEAG
jgi:uncharacterized phage protein (TIGR02220 family)